MWLGCVQGRCRNLQLAVVFSCRHHHCHLQTALHRPVPGQFTIYRNVVIVYSRHHPAIFRPPCIVLSQASLLSTVTAYSRHHPAIFRPPCIVLS